MASDQLANAMDSQDEMTVMRVPEDRRCEIAKAINWRRRSLSSLRRALAIAARMGMRAPALRFR
jgi:hypothetical protein